MHDFDTLFPIIPYDANMRHTQVPWLIEGLWQEGKINAMAAPEKSGKSRLLAWLLVGMERGEVLGLRAKSAGRVLYLAAEESVPEIVARFERYAGLQNSKPPAIDFTEASAMQLDMGSRRAALRNRIEKGAYDFVVIDPLRRVHNADENDSTEVARIHNDFRHWTNRLGVGMIILHHAPKFNRLEFDFTRVANWFRGSTDTAAILDTAQFVDRLDKQRIVLHRAGRFPPLEPIYVLDQTDEQGFVRTGKNG